MTETVIRMRGVRKRFGRVDVLRGIDLEVAAGQSFALVGANGAGKTTLLRCLLDLSALDAGTIEIHGGEHRRPGARARLAFLPERFVPPYFLTGREFLRAMLALYRRDYSEEAARAMLESLDLEESALERSVRGYSRGMTQKLGLAACLLAERELCVLDEPLEGLDPRARARLKQQLAALRARGQTLLFTSHVLADVEEICDHMAILHRGTLIWAGAPRELLARCGETSLEGAFLKCTEPATHA